MWFGETPAISHETGFPRSLSSYIVPGRTDLISNMDWQLNISTSAFPRINSPSIQTATSQLVIGISYLPFLLSVNERFADIHRC